jgi:hypothetical protein
VKSSSEGGGGDSGGARQKSDVRERPSVAENRRSGCLGDGDEGSALGRARTRRTTRGVRKIFGWRAAARRGGCRVEAEQKREREREGALGAVWSSTAACRRRGSGPATARAGRDSGGRQGRRDAVDVADRWAGARWGPGRQRLGATR